MTGGTTRETGPDHVHDLVSMSAALTRQLQQAGLGAPDWDQLAGEAISYSQRALGAVGAADPRRRTVAFNLGLLLLMRRISSESHADDQDAAIDAFEDFLASPDLAADGQQAEDRPDVARLALGWLLMFRAMRLTAPGLTPPSGPSQQLDLQRAIVAAMAGFSPAPGAADDIVRAVEALGRVAASATAPAQLRDMAKILYAGAKMVQATMFPSGEADMGALLGLISQAAQATGAGTPGRTEMMGLHAWLNAEHVRTSGIDDSDDAARDELEAATAAITPGHMLNAVLRLELGLTTVYRAQRAGGENLHQAAEHIAQAREEMVGWPSHPMYDDSLRLLTGTLLTATAWEPSPGGIEKTINLARQLLADRDPSDLAGLARDTHLLGMAYAIRAAREQRQEDWTAATGQMHQALTMIPADDPMRGSMLGVYAAVLNDHYQMRGSLADAEASQHLFDQLAGILDRPGADQGFEAHDVLSLTGLRGVCRVSLAWRTQDLAMLYRGKAEIQRALDGLPETYPWRSRLLVGLGLAEVASGVLRVDYARIRDGVALLTEAADAMQVDRGSRLGFRAVGALAQVMDGRLRSEDKAVQEGIAILAEVAGAPELTEAERLRMLWALGSSHLTRHGLVATDEDLDLGIARLEQARARADSDPGNPVAASLLWGLAEAYHSRGEADDLEQADETGLAALQARVYDVVLQRDAGHSLVIARGAADQAVTVARWLLGQQRYEAAVEALELGRGMVLHAATVNAWLTAILRAAGYADLAAEWDRAGQDDALDWAADPSDQPRAMTGMLVGGVLPVRELPSGLRRRVLSALREVTEFVRRLSTPSPDEIQAALRAAHADALVYLIPGTGEDEGLLLALLADGEIVSIPAAGLRVTPGGPVMAYAEAEQDDEKAWLTALESVTSWAWDVAIGPLLRAVEPRGLHREDGRTLPRLVLVPSGLLGAVPWHASWTGGQERAYACREAVFTYAASARQFTDTAHREWLPLNDNPVFVADPTGGYPGATFQTLALRGFFYPRSRGYGLTGEPGDPAGTPEQVLEHIPGPPGPGASLLQFSCHGVSSGTPMASHLALAGKLDVRRILQRAYSGRDLAAPGGLVVLAACVSDMTPGDYDEALTLSTTFLAAGSASVVGSRWDVSGLVTPVLMFMFHYFLQREGMAPADALQATQDWMLDPGRAVPPEMPSVIRRGMTTHDCADIAAWAAFTHQGR